MLTIKDACNLYHVTRQNLYALCEKGKFGAIRIGNHWILSHPPTKEQCTDIGTIAKTLRCSERRARTLCKERRVRCYKIGIKWIIPITEAAKLWVMRNQNNLQENR